MIRMEETPEVVDRYNRTGTSSTPVSRKMEASRLEIEIGSFK